MAQAAGTEQEAGCHTRPLDTCTISCADFDEHPTL